MSNTHLPSGQTHSPLDREQSSPPEQSEKLPDTLVRMKDAQSNPKGTVVFLPDFGGNVFYSWPLLPELSRELLCIGTCLADGQLEELDRGGVAALAARYAADIIAADLPRPIHLAGFSFAGYVAYETARMMSRSGQAPDRLWLFDTSVYRCLPGNSFVSAPLHETLYAARYGQKNWKRLIGLQKDDLVLHSYRRVRVDLSRHPEHYRTIIRSMYSALVAYQPNQWPGGDVLLFRATGESRHRSVPYDLGWSRIVDRTVEVREVPGDHLSMLREKDAGQKLGRFMVSGILGTSECPAD